VPLDHPGKGLGLLAGLAARQWVSADGPLLHREGPPAMLALALARVSGFPELAARLFGPNPLADRTPDIGTLLALEAASREPSFPAACFVHLDGDLTTWLDDLCRPELNLSFSATFIKHETGIRQFCIFLFSSGLPVFFKLFPVTLPEAPFRAVDPFLTSGRLAAASDEEAALVQESIVPLQSAMTSFWRLV